MRESLDLRDEFLTSVRSIGPCVRRLAAKVGACCVIVDVSGTLQANCKVTKAPSRPTVEKDVFLVVLAP